MAGREDVDNGAIVGERGASVGDGGCSDSDDSGGTSGGGAASIGVAVGSESWSLQNKLNKRGPKDIKRLRDLT